jgi:DNA-binding response OmpR family regulator
MAEATQFNPDKNDVAIDDDKLILVVDDEKDLRHLLRVSLEWVGYRVIEASNGAEAIAKFEKYPVDLVLLDVMMPKMDGFNVCTELRSRSEVPIVMLTALNDQDSIVRGLEMGVDDFIGKPFIFRELIARIRAILRRVDWLQNQSVSKIIAVGDVVLDNEAHQVTVRGEAVYLTPTEYRLLQYLMSHPNQPISKSILFQEVWGYEYTGSTNLVEVTMRRLREKIEKDPSKPTYLITVREVGYKFHSPNITHSQTRSKDKINRQAKIWLFEQITYANPLQERSL